MSSSRANIFVACCALAVWSAAAWIWFVRPAHAQRCDLVYWVAELADVSVSGGGEFSQEQVEGFGYIARFAQARRSTIDFGTNAGTLFMDRVDVAGDP